MSASKIVNDKNLALLQETAQSFVRRCHPMKQQDVIEALSANSSLEKLWDDISVQNELFHDENGREALTNPILYKKYLNHNSIGIF